MGVSGLVITLDPDERRADRAVRSILAAGPFHLGDRFGHHLAVVLEADTEREANDWSEWARWQPGVLKVDVAVVFFDDSEAARTAEVEHAC